MDGVIFDMGGVVIAWDPDSVLRACYADPAARSALKKALFAHPDWQAFDRGTLPQAELLARLATRTGRPPAELDGVLQAIRESLRPKPATLTLIERLHSRGVPLYVLSNMAGEIYAHLRQRHAWWGLFRGVTISGHLGLLKPERRIYEHLLATHRLRAAHSVFIDDLPANVEAAAALGMRAVRFHDAAQCGRDLEALLDAGKAAS